MTRSAPAAGPRGFEPSAIVNRTSDLQPSTYSAVSRSVDAVLAAGSPVRDGCAGGPWEGRLERGGWGPRS